MRTILYNKVSKNIDISITVEKIDSEAFNDECVTELRNMYIRLINRYYRLKHRSVKWDKNKSNVPRCFSSMRKKLTLIIL